MRERGREGVDLPDPPSLARVGVGAAGRAGRESRPARRGFGGMAGRGRARGSSPGGEEVSRCSLAGVERPEEGREGGREPALSALQKPALISPTVAHLQIFKKNKPII